MAKIVLTSRIASDYDDLREKRYHFPKARNYWDIARQAVGDWVVYYEPFTTGLPNPRFGGKRSYIAVARAVDVETDRNYPDHGYIHVEEYQEFERPVTYRQFNESALMLPDGSINKYEFRRSIRPIPDSEFQEIYQAGHPSGVPELLVDESVQSTPRKLTLDCLLDRQVRNYLFRQLVLETYGHRCAISGLELYDKAGHPEIQATHIQPWFKGGADVARNGLPLSGTIAWMFRRGLITLTNDLAIIRARALPKQLEALLPYSRAFGETMPKFSPHPSYLEFHREHIFERGEASDPAAA